MRSNKLGDGFNTIVHKENLFLAKLIFVIMDKENINITSIDSKMWVSLKQLLGVNVQTIYLAPFKQLDTCQVYLYTIYLASQTTWYKYKKCTNPHSIDQRLLYLSLLSRVGRQTQYKQQQKIQKNTFEKTFCWDIETAFFG